MSIEDDVALLERVPTLRLLGETSLRMLAIGCEQQAFGRGDFLFKAGDPADAGYVVQRGSFRVSNDEDGHAIVVTPGALIGELALLMPMARPSTAVAQEYSAVVRIGRSLFQRVLEADPTAARQLRDDFARRTTLITNEILMAGAKLGS
jgi:CRP-like cAMP-binding protein